MYSPQHTWCGIVVDGDPLEGRRLLLGGGPRAKTRVGTGGGGRVGGRKKQKGRGQEKSEGIGVRNKVGRDNEEKGEKERNRKVRWRGSTRGRIEAGRGRKGGVMREKGQGEEGGRAGCRGRKGGVKREEGKGEEGGRAG